jgi:hypothetical protein
MGHRPQVPLLGLPRCRNTLGWGSIQNELGESNEAGLTELARGQVLSPKVDSLDSLDSIDSIESLDSLNSLDSLGPTHSSSLLTLSLSLSLSSLLFLSFPPLTT